MEFSHISVLLDESINSLSVKQIGIYVDGTLGGGGHSSRLLTQSEGAKLIGIDRDTEALAAAYDVLVFTVTLCSDDTPAVI